jgi:hypothetical protein
MPRSRRGAQVSPILAPLAPTVRYNFKFDPKVGIAERDPDNYSKYLYYVCAKSVHDPSFEVRTTPPHLLSIASTLKRCRRAIP